MARVTDSKFIVQLKNGLLHVQCKVDSVPLADALKAGFVSAEKKAQESEYRLKYTLTKKMRQAIREAVSSGKTHFTIEQAPVILAVQADRLTFVFKGEINLGKLRKTDGVYELKASGAPQLELFLRFSEAFYRNELAPAKKPRPAAGPKQAERPAAKSQGTARKPKPTKKSRRQSSPVSYWAADGSRVETVGAASMAPPKAPPVYRTYSELHNCRNCQNLNANNYCTVQKDKVNEDDVCSRFYRMSIVLGGAVNPR